jgi:choline dehydrogenase-like flavoprotein
MGIAPIVDLPVGRNNLQDHLVVSLFFSRDRNASSFRDTMRFDRMALAMTRAWLFGTGPGTVVPGGMHAFIKTRPELEVPDIEFLFRGAPADAHLWFPGLKRPYRDGYAIRAALLHPESRGEVRLRSADPRDPIRIYYNFLSAPNDIAALRDGFKRAREVAYHSALDPWRGEQLTPGPEIKSDAQIDEWIRNTVVTVEHPVATCPMGSGPDAVLDPELRVRGTEGLRVVDAAAMPDLVSAHTNACVLMIGEKASDMIRGLPALPAVANA